MDAREKMVRFTYGLVAVGLLVGCAPSEEARVGNARLGVEQFVVDEQADATHIVGLDADGAEVVRLDLVHGAFHMSDFYADVDGGMDVVGRKLDVSFAGQPKLKWETEGFEPVTDLPALHPNETQLIALFDDPLVKALFDRWRIGITSENGGGEAAYAWGEEWDTGPGARDCRTIDPSGTGPKNCGTTNPDGTGNRTINTCGNSAAAIDAWKLTAGMGIVIGHPAGYSYGSANRNVVQSTIIQWCPAGSGGFSGVWYASKTCRETVASPPYDWSSFNPTSLGIEGYNWPNSQSSTTFECMYPVPTTTGAASCTSTSQCPAYHWCAPYNHQCMPAMWDNGWTTGAGCQKPSNACVANWSILSGGAHTITPVSAGYGWTGIHWEDYRPNGTCSTSNDCPSWSPLCQSGSCGAYPDSATCEGLRESCSYYNDPSSPACQTELANYCWTIVGQPQWTEPPQYDCGLCDGLLEYCNYYGYPYPTCSLDDPQWYACVNNC